MSGTRDSYPDAYIELQREALTQFQQRMHWELLEAGVIARLAEIAHLSRSGSRKVLKVPRLLDCVFAPAVTTRRVRGDDTRVINVAAIELIPATGNPAQINHQYHYFRVGELDSGEMVWPYENILPTDAELVATQTLELTRAKKYGELPNLGPGLLSIIKPQLRPLAK